jgi:hypothetical protein
MSDSSFLDSIGINPKYHHWQEIDTNYYPIRPAWVLCPLPKSLKPVLLIEKILPGVGQSVKHHVRTITAELEFLTTNSPNHVSAI